MPRVMGPRERRQYRDATAKRLLEVEVADHTALAEMLQTALGKIGAKVVRHAGYPCFQLAETSVPKQLFLAIVARIRRPMEPVPI